MTRDEAQILEKALRLPPEARAALAGFLLDSLEGAPEPDAEAAWEAEIAARLRDLDSGTSRTIPWSEARKKILGG